MLEFALKLEIVTYNLNLIEMVILLGIKVKKYNFLTRSPYSNKFNPPLDDAIYPS